MNEITNHVTSIGIIGAGNLGQAFASQAIRAGYRVILSNRRGPDSLREVVSRMGPLAEAGTSITAAQADLVFVSVYWPEIEQALSGIDFENRIVIDANNPALLPDFRLAELDGRTSTEQFQDWAWRARVVKAFNTLPIDVLTRDPNEHGGRRVVLVAGDDAPAKAVVGQVIDRMGFATIDLGLLREAGNLSQFPGGPFAGLNLIQLG